MKKLGAYLLSAVMFLSVIFGGNPSLSVYADDLPAGRISLSVGESGGSSTGMEIGDEVIVNIKLSQSMYVNSIVGTFSYSTEVFEEIEGGAIQTTDGLLGGYHNGTLRLSTSDTDSDPVTVSGTIATITLKVKKATDTAVFKYTGIDFDTGSNVYTNVSADDLNVTNSKKDDRIFEIGMESAVSVNDKETIQIPVTIEKNTGFISMGITVNYGTGLIFESVELSSEMRAYVSLNSVYENKSEKKVTLSISSATKDIKIVGKDLLYLNFEADADTGSADVTVTVSQLVNQSHVEMKGDEPGSNSKTCTVSFAEELPMGDVNGDTKVDLIDATYVLQYYNGIMELTSEQVKRADVNDSNTVTLVDALQIMKYYNGEIKRF